MKTKIDNEYDKKKKAFYDINALQIFRQLFHIDINNHVKNYFAVWIIIASLWLISSLLFVYVKNRFWASLELMFEITSIASAVILTIGFSLQKKLSSIAMLSTYAVGIFLAVITLTDPKFIMETNQGIILNYTTWYFVFLEYAFLLLLFLGYETYRCTKFYKDDRRMQARYMFKTVYTFGPIFLGLKVLLPIIGISWYGYIYIVASMVFAGFSIYAMYHGNMMQEKQFIKRSTIYGIMVIFITGIYFTAIFVFENILRLFVGYNSFYARFFASIVVAVSFLPIRNKIEAVINKLFFKTKYEYTQTLHDFTHSIMTVLDLRKLISEIVENISRTLNVGKVAMFIFEKESQEYKIHASKGIEDENRNVKLTAKQTLVQRLKQDKDIIKFKEFSSKRPGEKTFFKQIEPMAPEIFVPMSFNERLVGILMIGEKLSGEKYDEDDINLLRVIGNETAIALSNALSYSNLKRNYLGTVKSLSKAIEAKDIYTRGHSERVVRYAVIIGREMALNRDEIEILEFGGLLHDIGKIAINERILRKTTDLTKEEFENIKAHPLLGENIIAPISFLENIKGIVRHHHERWDGKGYPDGLIKDKIPILARIIQVADTFDAITSSRSYREARSFDEAVREIDKCAGTHFDPQIVYYLMRALRKNMVAI
ncbi:MAG: HD domain-containing phosphohydrolase [Elusimicrobiota bacterium]